MASPKVFDETPFIPQTLEQALQLREALVQGGTPLAMARAVVMWLAELPTLERVSDDPTWPTQRRDYRLRLKALGTPPWEGARTRVAISSKGAYHGNRASRGPLSRRPQGASRPRIVMPKSAAA